MTQRVHIEALPRARLNESGATPGGEIVGGHARDVADIGWQLSGSERRTEIAGDLNRNISNKLRPKRDTMIGKGAR